MVKVPEKENGHSERDNITDSDGALSDGKSFSGEKKADNNNGIIEEGYIISEKYEIVKLIGKGGMADVYLAKDISSGQKVAVKVLKQELNNDSEFIRRFDAEAQTVASLSHPSIVNVFDVGKEERFRYIVLEYIDGISLKELIEKNESLDYEVAVPIAIQIGLALENAHRTGIIHRDIKPHNILITSNFVAKVTDFGIARTISSNTVTLSGKNTMGSVHYFSPEQARGGIVGEQSDIYSLGVVLYEMLTGTLPFNGETPVSVALKHIQNKIVPPSKINPEIPEGLSKIVVKCMQKSCELRYKTARDLVDELDAFMVDPQGDYGYIDRSEDTKKTSVVKAMDKDSNFRKLKEVEHAEKEVKVSKIKERIIVVFAVLFIAGAITVAVYYAIEWIKQQIATPVQNEYIVENFIGMEIEQAITRLERENINYNISYEENETVPQGIVFYQSIQQGLVLRPGGASSISLKVSSGKDTVKLEDYTGRNYRLVQNEITQILGLSVVIEKELSGEYGKDIIIGTIPEGGNDVPKGSQVILIVSEGLMDVEVPDILGMQKEQAYELIEENHLTILSEAFLGSDPNLPEEDEYIIGVEPLPGTVVRALTGLIISLGSYEDYENSLLPVPTPTPVPETSPQEDTEPDTENQTEG